MPARGSWTVTAAIIARWHAFNLDDSFNTVGEWTEAKRSQFLVLQDTEAKPGTPMPYCILEQERSIPGERMSGLDAITEKRLEKVPFQLTVYARTKEQARDMAKLVVAAFDSGALNVEDDALVNIFRGPDFPVRHSEKTWAWALLYTVEIDCTYRASLA